MSRLSLVIADQDADYLVKFEKYLMVHFPQRFELFSFSSPIKLSDFLNRSEKIDILLVNRKLYRRELPLECVNTIIILEGDSADPAEEGQKTVVKYQQADQLVTKILGHYASANTKNVAAEKESNTHIVGVYSPSGGTGKSSIAAGCSMICSQRGEKVFYLNLEDIPSTRAFFGGYAEQTFSSVLFHLKGNGNNLNLKLEGARCCDPKTDVCYFAPPDNILELEELSEQDTVRLVRSLKASAVYDRIFIDLSCGLNRRNMAVLEIVDVVLLVLAPGVTSSVKRSVWRESVRVLEQKYDRILADKTVTVLNRCIIKPNEDRNGLDEERRFVEIGECISRGGGTASALTENVSFLSGLGRLLEHVLPCSEAAELKTGGGGLFV